MIAMSPHWSKAACPSNCQSALLIYYLVPGSDALCSVIPQWSISWDTQCGLDSGRQEHSQVPVSHRTGVPHLRPSCGGVLLCYGTTPLRRDRQL